MTYAVNAQSNVATKKTEYSALILWGIVFFLLLLLRDTYSVGIDKNIFIVITCFSAVSMKTKHLIYLFCFLFPLYVGLPGNYMTLVLIVRLLFDASKFKFKLSSLSLNLLVSGFMICQNTLTGYTGIVPMMFVAGLIFVLLLFSYEEKLDTIPMIVMYAAGVAGLGYIMLSSTLQVYDLSDLLSASFRLGSANVNYVEEGMMNVSIDPNFYGTFAIAAIATAVPLVLKSSMKIPLKVFLSCLILVDVVVCLIGLSRAFIVVFALWVVLYLFSQKNIKGMMLALVAIAGIIILVAAVLPNVLDVALARFEDSDVVSGNGRIDMIVAFFAQWQETVLSLLFGVGLYNCNVHCMPLQFLFGGGIVLFVLMLMLVVSYRTGGKSSLSPASMLPIAVTFVMMCSIPAAGLLNFMFPLVFLGVLLKQSESVTLETEKMV